MHQTKLAVLALLTLSPAAMATGNNMARAIISPSFSGGGGPVDHIVNSAGPADSTGASTGGFGSSGSAESHINYTRMTMQSQAVGSLNAQGTGNVHDVLLITAPGIPIHTSGTLTYTITIDGTMTAPSGSSASTWRVQMGLGGGASSLTRTGTLYSPNLAAGGYQGDPLGTYSVTIPFEFGVATSIDIAVSAVSQAAFASGVPTASATCNLSPGFTWNGISNVKVNGVPVAGVGVTSDSGTAWGPGAGTCTADFNGDGDVGTDADIEAFFACLAGNCCATCGSADFNNDGDTGTDADIESFFRVLGGGPC